MRIAPISSVTLDSKRSNQPQFEARFSESEIKQITKEAKEVYGKTAIPMLDILFKLLRAVPGKVAHIKTTKTKQGGLTYTRKLLTIDRKDKAGDSGYRDSSGLSLLKKFLVGDNYNSEFVLMPERIFEQEWWYKGVRNEEALLSHALPKPAPPKKHVPVDWAKEVTPPKPVLARLELNVKNVKPYNVVKEIYKNKQGEKVIISNIDILAKSKTPEGIAELDAIEQTLLSPFKSIFAQKRTAAKMEIEKQAERLSKTQNKK